MINQWQGKADTLRLCRLLGVSRSGVYAARQRYRRTQVASALATQLKEAFDASGGNYGSRRLHACLRAQGHSVGRHRVRHLMKQQGLRVRRYKRKVAYTNSSHHELLIADNVLDRQFTPEAPDRSWVADITYIRTHRGWLYLAAVLDLYSRKVVGWAMGPNLQTTLVCNALNMAITLRQPRPGLVVHTDRGPQYTCQVYRDLLARHGLIVSMSRRANCWDNAVMERFFLSLKTERVWQQRYDNPTEATRDVTQYIAGFYNTHRLHSTLGYLSPADYEKTNMATL